MRWNKPMIVSAICGAMLSAGLPSARATQPIRISPMSGPATIELSPQSSFLQLDSMDNGTRVRQTSTPVLVVVRGNASLSFPIEIYACVNSDDALKGSGKAAAMSASNLRIRNDQGEWTRLKPLPELDGRLGVRIAIVNSAQTTVMLQVQLRIPAGQSPGTYQGNLTLEAKDQTRMRF